MGRRGASAARLCLLLMLAAIAGPAAAAEITISVQRPILAVGDRTSVTVAVQGASTQSRPTLTSPDGFDLVLAGEVSGFSMSRGRTVGNSTFTYQLTAKKAGDWTLGPARVNVGGSVLSTDPVAIKIVARQANAAPGEAGSWDWASRKVRARAVVSNPTPYVGEALVWTMEVASASGARYVVDEALDRGTMSFEPGLDPQWTQEMTVQDGYRVVVTTQPVALFAVEEEPTRVRGEVLLGSSPSTLFGSREKVAFPEVTIRPRSLPPNAPREFGGEVGRFTLRTSVGAEEVRAGETLALRVQIEGSGALRAPEVSMDLPEGVKVYDEAPEVQMGIVGGTVQSRAVLGKTLVPLVPGRLTIPAVRFTYLDPETQRYETAMSRPLTVRVTGDAVAEPQVARSEALGMNKEEVEILSADILPLRTGDRLLGDRRFGLTHPLILALLLLPTLGLGGVVTIQARSRAAGSDRGRAAAKAREAKEAVRAAQDAAASDDLDAAEAALRAWLSARLPRSGASLSPTEAEAVLKAAGAPGEVGADLASLLARIEGVRFGGERSEGLAGAIAAWLASAGSWR